MIGVSTNPTRKHFFVDQLLPVPIVGLLLLPPPAGKCCDMHETMWAPFLFGRDFSFILYADSFMLTPGRGNLCVIDPQR